MIIEQLERQFTIRQLAAEQTAIADDVDILLLIHPHGLSDSALYAADQFVLRGGATLALTDPLSETSLSGFAAAREPNPTADRLLADFDRLESWPEHVVTMQRNWIGRSVGARIDFQLEDGSGPLTIFTTRPDTLFGATYCVLAPEHPLVERITAPSQSEPPDVAQTLCSGFSLKRSKMARVLELYPFPSISLPYSACSSER